MKFLRLENTLKLQAIILTALCVISFAEIEVGQTDPNDTLPPLEQRMQQVIEKIDFQDVPIDTAIISLTSPANVDVIMSPEVIGNVTVSLSNVPLEEALNNILAVHNYSYITTKNMIRIVPVTDIIARPERLLTETFEITYADVADVVKALDDFKSDRGNVSFNKGTSHIIVTDTESKITAMGDFVKTIDRVTPQVLVEVKIYDITSKDRLDLGVDWFAGTNTTFDSEGLAVGGKTEPFSQGIFNSPVNKADGSNNSIRFGFLNDSVDIDVLLRAEQENICATLLANPRILVLDNETATFESISEIPYQQLQETSAGGTIGTTEFREVGVSLKVVPHIVSKDNMIRLRVAPEFSVVTGEVIVGGFAVESPQPVVDTRRADSVLLVRNDQTIVLGGLRKKEINIQDNKVPWLGDIPLIGAAFRFHGEETVTSELVVFLTPRIVTNPVMTDIEQDYLDKTEICPPQCPPAELESCIN